MAVGSLRDFERVNAVVESIQFLLGDKPNQLVESLASKIAEIIPLRTSTKHMSGNDLGRLETSQSLRYKNAA